MVRRAGPAVGRNLSHFRETVGEAKMQYCHYCGTIRFMGINQKTTGRKYLKKRRGSLMTNAPKVIAEFSSCFKCGSMEKISELGCMEAKEKGKIAKEAFTSLKQEVTPLEQPTMAGIMVQALITTGMCVVSVAPKGVPRQSSSWCRFRCSYQGKCRPGGRCLLWAGGRRVELK